MQSPSPAHESPPIKPGFVTEFLDFLRYLRTRKAVRSGIPLYEFTQAELGRGRYSGPWTFNLQQSALSALPAIVVFAVYDFAFPVESPRISLPDPFWQSVEELVPSILGKINPLFPPLALTLTAYAAAVGSLRWRDLSRTAFARNSRAFLYYDGAFGLIPQMLLAFLFSINWMTPNGPPGGALQPYVIGAAIAIWVIGMGAAFYQFYLNLRFIPRKLFALHGYDLAIHSFWQGGWATTPRRAPWFYYSVCFFVIAVVIQLLYYLITLLCYGIAIAAVWLKYETLGHV